MQGDRPTHIEAEIVEAQFGHRIGSGIEIVAGIERIIAPKIPSGGMKLPRARLDGHADRASRREPVLRTIV